MLPLTVPKIVNKTLYIPAGMPWALANNITITNKGSQRINFEEDNIHHGVLDPGGMLSTGVKKYIIYSLADIEIDWTDNTYDNNTQESCNHFWNINDRGQTECMNCYSIDFPGVKKKVCNHEWVTTQGFSKQYVDCKLCGIKQEEEK